MLVRDAVPADAEAIRRIYNHEVTSSTATFDLETRSLEEQTRWLGDRSGVHVVVVAVDPETDEVAGFASLSPYKDRAAYRTTVEDSVYIDAEHRGRGIGSTLLNAVLDRARDHGFHVVMARIGGGESNPGSIAVHASCGFELVGIEREVGRKLGRWVDVAVMQRIL